MCLTAHRHKKTVNIYHTSRSRSLICLILAPEAPPLDETTSMSFFVHWSSLAMKVPSRFTVVILLNSSFICGTQHEEINYSVLALISTKSFFCSNNSE